jgi:hypothetical protein
MKQIISNRRQFIQQGLACGVAATLMPLSAPANVKNKISMQKGDPIKPELVKEFVAKAHADINRVQELLQQEPRLLNASWDWGSGDFETAMGAAGHMGRADIAQFLLSNGARMDLFAAAMLGQLDIVKSTLLAYPTLKSSKGPHGLTLIHHARQGGEASRQVFDYLMEIGAS